MAYSDSEYWLNFFKHFNFDNDINDYNFTDVNFTLGNLPTYVDYDYDYPSMALPRTDQAVLIFAFSVNMVLSLLGNTLVLLVLLCGRTNRTDLSAFLINLAVADLLMAIFCMPFTFPTIMLGHWIFGKTMCYAAMFLQNVSVVVSIGTLTAVGIDRYFAVMFPLKARFTKKRSVVLFAVIWFIAVMLSICQAVFTKYEDDYYDGRITYSCFEKYPSTLFGKVWEWCFLAITYFMPLVILTYTYAKVGHRLWGRRIPGNADKNRDKNFNKSKRKVIKMLVVIVVMFALCWLPLHVFKLITLYFPHLSDNVESSIESQDRMRIIQACVLWLALSNSFVNPIIYGFLNDGFTTDAKVLFKSCCCKRSFLLRTISERSTTLARLTSSSYQSSATKKSRKKTIAKSSA
ncbi:RYamide receptor-like [Glandiceps talaboti]